MQSGRRIEIVVTMTIQIPDELARGLEGIAAAEHKSVEQLAVERLQSLVKKSMSPAELLQYLRSLPHPSREAVEDMKAAIAAGRIPVRDRGVFDE